VSAAKPVGPIFLVIMSVMGLAAKRAKFGEEKRRNSVSRKREQEEKKERNVDG